jgi:hypothetical protein
LGAGGAIWSHCEQILREGLAIPDVGDRANIIDRLADACEEQGRGEEAVELRRQAKRSDDAREYSSRHQAKGRQKRAMPLLSGKQFKKCTGGSASGNSGLCFDADGPHTA